MTNRLLLGLILLLTFFADVGSGQSPLDKPKSDDIDGLLADAGADIKLEPLEIKLFGEEFVLQAPVGMKVEYGGGIVNLRLDYAHIIRFWVGRANQPWDVEREKKRTLTYRGADSHGKEWSYRLDNLLLNTERVVVSETEKVPFKERHFYFCQNFTFGYLDLHASSADGARTREECLRALKWVRTLRPKNPIPLIDTPAALEKRGLRLGRDKDGRITELNLGEIHLTDSGLTQLAKAAPHLRSLGLTTPLTDAGLDALRHFKNARSLSLPGHGPLEYTNLSFFREMTQLEDLRLAGHPIGDKALAHLQDLVHHRRIPRP